MSINELNVFGSLTINGKKLSFGDFATNFETTYNAWVEGEKAKKANV